MTAGQGNCRTPWFAGWQTYLGRAVVLVYVIYVAGAIGQYSRGAAAICGYVLLGVFCACWLLIPVLVRELSAGKFWAAYAGLLVPFIAEVPFARGQAFILAVFVGSLTVFRLGARGWPVVAAFSAAALLVPVAIPAWHVSIGEAWGDVTPIAIPIAALMTLAVSRVVQANQALADTRSELASLAAENERFRIARDLHDLLGHSLTSITVKAGLASRLAQADPARAVQEITEVEALARQTLNDVRVAVANYREVTLAGELATGRELLRAAGIAADLPRAVDVVEPGHRELFGWVVREGLTNIVRHSRASTCSIRLSASSVEIVDDGVGGAAPPGNGLSGLRERVKGAGGVVDAGPLQPKGWRLLVSLTTVGDAA